MMMGSEAGRGRAAAALLAAAFAAALFMRHQLMVAYGGAGDYLEWAVRHYVGGIPPGYLSLAGELMQGRYPFLGYPPGYPAIIALARLAGIEGIEGLRLAQAAIDSLGVPLMYFVLRRAGLNRALSLCAAATYAAYPLFAAGSTQLLAEFVSPVFMLVTLALAVAISDRPKPPALLLAAGGLLLGLGALVRPDLLLLPAVPAASLFLRGDGRRTAAAVAILLAAAAVPVAGWGLHNRLVHGHWVFTSTAAGNSLWEGLGEIPNEHGYTLDDGVAGRVAQERGFKWLSVEADRYFRSEYLRAWKEHPNFVLMVIATRWQRIATESEAWLTRALPIVRLQQLFDVGGYVLLAGAILLYRRSPVALLLVIVPIAYAMLTIGLTHFEPRYTRYVHLSYLFASFLITGFVIDRAGAHSGLAATAGSVFACAATAWAVGAAIVSAGDEARLARTSVAPPAAHRSPQ